MIEPMSIEEIAKQLIGAKELEPAQPHDVKRLILAWVHAEARARQLGHDDNCEQCFTAYHQKDRCKKAGWHELQDWIAALKAEVGWPED